MRNSLHFLPLFLIFAVIFDLSGQISGSANYDYYQKGLEYKKNGNWSKALQTWVAGSQRLQREGKSDPQIGIAFIELATEMKVKQWYNLACNLYNWGFSQSDIIKSREDIKQEIARIAPLMNKNEYQEWKGLLRRENNLLTEKIRSFWQAKDPTPSTELNERLVEHWERIAYARKNYQNANTTAYRTDDRGLIYVKYGKPERIKTGALGTNRAVMKIWSDVILEAEAGESGDGYLTNSELNKTVEQSLLLESVDRFNNSPDYEIWFYHSLSSDEPLFFMFGNIGGTGRYGLRNGIEDFIPRRAFMRSNTKLGAGILPGAILQSVYYSELSHLHPYFADRFYDLESMWDTIDRSGTAALSQFNNAVKNKRLLFESMDSTDPVKASAPSDKSNFDKSVSEVDLVVEPFRFLGDKQKPMLALVTFSYPKIKSKYINISSKQISLDYSTTHTIILLDKNKEEIKRLTDAVPTGYDNISTFILPHVTNQNEYRLYAEVFNIESNELELVKQGQSEKSPEIIGVGNKDIPGTQPLSISTDKLELSDLIIGVNSPDESETERLPFPVIPSRKIWSSDVLKIYLEIYHLYFAQDGIAHFTIDFKVSKLKDQTGDRKESISLSFDFDSPNSTSRESFGVDISNLTPGQFELSVLVTDTVSMQQKQRQAIFEIVRED